MFAALIWYWSRIVLNAAARSSRVGCFLDFVAVFITPPWEALIRGRMMQLPSAGKCHFSSPTMKRNISKYKRKRPEATPAYITVAIETGIATVGRRSGTINTRDAVGAKKQAELVEPGPKTVESLTTLASHFGVATKPVLMSPLPKKPTSWPLSLMPLTVVWPMPLGSSTDANLPF